MPLGKILSTVRKELKLSLEYVSTHTGIGASSLSDFENEKRPPSLSQLQTLASFYHKPLSFFFEEAEPQPLEAIIWRNKPESPKRELLEAEFTQLCEQYYNLEVWTNNHAVSTFKKLFVNQPVNNISEVEVLAADISRRMGLGDYPGPVLLRILEECYDVKIFHLDLGNDAISACHFDETYGAAILLNLNKKRWRRNFDLAHELFHLLIWKASECGDKKESVLEEKLAQHFAGCLLMPSEKVKEAIESARNPEGKVSFDKFDDIARLFEVSLDALLLRLKILYGIPNDLYEKLKNKAESCKEPREDSPADFYPERYCSLADQALRNGEISIGRYIEYLKYLKITRKKAEEILSSNVLEPFEVPANHF